MKNNIGPISLTSYISFTLIFFIAKSQMGFSPSDTSWIWYFLIITGIMQFINNLYITQYPEVCGSYNITSALSATLVPWIFIFGLSCVCLVFIPGWLRVFSNTFGHMVANWAGLNKIINDIFTVPSGATQENEKIKEAVTLLYTNRSKFINEIELDYIADEKSDEYNKGQNWPSLDKILTFMQINKPTITTDSEGKDVNLYKELYKLLVLKEDMGYFAWLTLIGSISVLISTNSLLMTTCDSVDFNL
jgi:hypothetical protein